MTFLYICAIILFLCLLLMGTGYIIRKHPDPVRDCPYYKEQDCSFVDGPYCDMDNCTVLRTYQQMKEAGAEKRKRLT